MTPHARLLASLRTLRWHASDLSVLLDVSENTCRKWEAGKSAAPETVLTWLELLAVFVRANPPPAGGRAAGRPRATKPQPDRADAA